MAIITTDSVYLAPIKYNNLTPEQQTWVSGVLDACSDYLEKYLNRYLAAQDYTEYVNGTGLEFIQIKNPPINSLTSIQFGDDDATDDSEFSYEPNTGEIQWLDNCGGVFPRGFRNIIVIYNGGYTTIPTPLQMICAEMVMESTKRDVLEANVEKEKIGEYFVDFGKLDNLLMSRKKMLSLYKLRVV